MCIYTFKRGERRKKLRKTRSRKLYTGILPPRHIIIMCINGRRLPYAIAAANSI